MSLVTKRNVSIKTLKSSFKQDEKKSERKETNLISNFLKVQKKPAFWILSLFLEQSKIFQQFVVLLIRDVKRKKKLKIVET